MFPPVEYADEDGLLCWGGEATPETLRLAYRAGVFPWPHEGLPLLWFAPPLRGILFLDEFKLNSRTRRYLRAQNFEIRVDTCFRRVMRACGQPRRYQGEWETGTWVTKEIMRAYTSLHESGEAHSVEAFQDGQLVGGLYGVSWGGYFCGESMFYREPNASKAALAWLVEYLQFKGAGWIDCQLLTPHFEVMGAREVPREEYMVMLEQALSADIRLF
jgi:leucyl/phenylalanyl-tRNA--protein transferase